MTMARCQVGDLLPKRKPQGKVMRRHANRSRPLRLAFLVPVSALAIVATGLSAGPVRAAPGQSSGGISGTVTAAAGGAPVSGVTVDVLDYDSTNQLASVTTSAAGTYTVTGLVPASRGYTVCFDASAAPGGPTGFVSQCYKGVVWMAGASQPDGVTPVGVTAGATTTGINAALVSAGVISGRVTAAAGGAPVSGVQAIVTDGSGIDLTSATTSAAGTYTLTGLPPASGGDTVCFDASQAAGSAIGFASQCYKGVAWTAGSEPSAGATPVAVRAGTRTTGINAALTLDGAISGRVTAADGGVAVSGVVVDVLDDTGIELASATTSAAGTYTVTGLPPVSGGDDGDIVCFDAFGLPGRGTGFVSQCYKGLAWAAGGAPPAGLTGVGVRAGAATTINAALAPGGAVSGRVTAAAGGAPVSGVQVDVMEGDGYQLAATTSAAGFYTVTGLLPASGGDVVCFDATDAGGNATGFASQCYKGAAWTAGNAPPAGVTPVSVRSGTTTGGISAALTALGAISGRVTTAAGGAPVSGVHVGVLDGSGNYLTGSATSATGAYFVPGLAPASGGYIVCFDASQVPGSATGFASQCYKDVAWSGSSLPGGVTRVGVSTGTTTAGIDAALTPGGAISGRVTAAAGGAPVSGVNVDVVDGRGNQLASATTSAAGTYSVTSLAPASGGYIVCFDAADAPGNATGFASQCYKGLAWAYGNAPPAGVTLVRVRAGTTTAGINAALTALGAISGTVTAAADGAPVSGVTVDVFDASGYSLTGLITSATGTYSVTGLAPASGGDIVCFEASQAPGSATGFASQCYRGVPWAGGLSRPSAGATPVKVRAGTTTAGIDAVLTSAPAGQGQARVPHPARIPDARRAGDEPAVAGPARPGAGPEAVRRVQRR